MIKKVLIVDDDPSMLRLLAKYLADGGYEPVQASNGQEALRLVLAEAPAIIVTDWEMPEMDGVSLCRALREHEGVRFAYIIIVTAHSEVDRVTEAFEAGADDFISKPVRRLELLARLRAGEHIARLEDDLAKRMREIHRLNAEMALANEKLATANDKLKQMATTDELTGLVNRREGMNRLRQLWQLRDRYGDLISCIMLDIDHFKKVNDTYGHALGDVVLREFAGVVQKSLRATDIACRIGGEEFLVLCPNTGAKEAAACAEHIRTATEGHDFFHNGVHLKVTVSAGIAECSDEMPNPDELLRKADDALYESKQSGRNRLTVARETLRAAST